MKIETISITKFKNSLTRLCRSVRAGKSELIVTVYNRPMFRVKKIDDEMVTACSFTDVRERTPEFLDLIESEGVIMLASKYKPSVMCVKI